MQRIEPELKGITREEIQSIFENTLRDFKESKTRVIYLDASYLYTFHLSDMDYVRKLHKLMQYDSRNVVEWHAQLERWFNDQTVNLPFKPIQISRTFDRVVNEGLEAIAGAITASDPDAFNWRGIGQGEGEALPSDRTLIDEIDRLNVFESVEGGVLTRDGSTVYSVGNHIKSVPSATVTECGMFTTGTSADDKMFEHSMFEDPVVHVQNADSIGSTTVIYMCGA